jgi:hypothetical protein
VLSEWGGRRAPWASAAICALLIAGCGSSGSGSSTVSASAYAKSLCTAVAPFEKDIATRQQALDPTKIKNAAQGKTELVAFLQAIAGDTGKAAADLKGAGTPDVKDGKAIASAFTQVFTRLDEALGHAVKQAQAIPTSSPDAFKQAALTLATDVKGSMGNLGSALGNLKSPELETAAKKVPACTTLGG